MNQDSDSVSSSQELSQRIVEIQKQLLSEVEKSRAEKIRHERKIELLLTRVIEILDLIEPISSPTSASTSLPDSDRLIRKTQKRVAGILSEIGVEEIKVSSVGLKTGYVRVLESHGNEMQLCRRGYTLGGRVVRAAEVIT